MHITKEDTGSLTASIRLQIGREDYDEKVLKTLKDYQRKATIPGFRPGKVPFGMIAKIYRKGVMLDEINHLMAENLQKFIEENKLKLIGNPIPDKDKAPNFDLDTQSDFEFFFDIGLAPEFSIDQLNNIPVDYYKISATEKMIDDQIREIRHRAAHQEHHDHDHDHDHEHEHEHKEEEKHDDETLPALDEDFFSKVFPGAEIKDEVAFRLKIKEAIEQSLFKESERFFMNSAVEALVNGINFELPDEFLKKAMHENNENKLSEEDIEKQYDNFARSVRWQLIESRLIQEKGLHVAEQEMRDVVKSYFTGHMVNNEVNEEQDERLNKIVDSVLENKEESNRLYDQLYDQKLLTFFKSGLKLENKEVDYDSFVKIVTKKNE